MEHLIGPRYVTLSLKARIQQCIVPPIACHVVASTPFAAGSRLRESELHSIAYVAWSGHKCMLAPNTASCRFLLTPSSMTKHGATGERGIQGDRPPTSVDCYGVLFDAGGRDSHHWRAVCI